MRSLKRKRWPIMPLLVIVFIAYHITDCIDSLSYHRQIVLIAYHISDCGDSLSYKMVYSYPIISLIVLQVLEKRPY